MMEAAFQHDHTPEHIPREHLTDWHAKLTHTLLTKGSPEQDGTYFAIFLNESTYATVTNYATATCHADYHIDSHDRSQHASLEAGNPIISVEIFDTEAQTARGFAIYRPIDVRQNSILHALLEITDHPARRPEEFVIINTSDATEVSPEALIDSPLYAVLQATK